MSGLRRPITQVIQAQRLSVGGAPTCQPRGITFFVRISRVIALLCWAERASLPSTSQTCWAPRDKGPLPWAGAGRRGNQAGPERRQRGAGRPRTERHKTRSGALSLPPAVVWTQRSPQATGKPLPWPQRSSRLTDALQVTTEDGHGRVGPPGRVQVDSQLPSFCWKTKPPAGSLL